MSETWILIPNCNGLRWLPDCLSSLRRSIATTDAQVLVVDNASTDGGQEYVERYFPEFHLAKLKQNLGFVDAMNLGILQARQAGARRVVLLNNDTRMTRDWLTILLDVAAKRPDLGILGVLQKDFDDVPSPRSQATVRQWSQTVGADVDWDSLPDVIETDWVEGSCILIQDWVIDQVGYLDSIYAPAYFEEIDFCRRARRNGVGIGLVTRSMIWHFGAGTASNAPKRSRQRILMERNYLLYRSAGVEKGWIHPYRRLLSRSFSHGIRQWLKGLLSFREWLAAVSGLPRMIGALAAKLDRDRAQRPCPLLGDGLPMTSQRRYVSECIERIQCGDSLCQRSDTYEPAPRTDSHQTSVLACESR